MELHGTIIQILPEESGTGKTGNTWRKQLYILETKDQYPKKICFQVWGDKIDQYGLQVGDDATVGIDLESREFSGRWYTDVKAWKVQKGNAAPGSSTPPPPPPPADDRNLVPPPMADDSDDLPF